MDTSISRPTTHSIPTPRHRLRKKFSLVCLLGLIVAFVSVTPLVSSATITSTASETATKSNIAPNATSISPTNSVNNTASVTTTLPSPTPQPTSSQNQDDLATVCKPPLIPNTQQVVSDSCTPTCCVPCPVAFSFYEPDSLFTLYTTTSYIRIASAIVCAILAFAYIVLPSRRHHPHIIVTCFALILIPFDAMGTPWLHSDKSLLCHNTYEIATMSNSWFCGVQGITIAYLAFVILCLAVLLIANLHFLTVFQSFLIQNNMTKLIVISFILPLASIVPVAIRKQFEYPGFGSVCFMKPEIAGPFFFYPLAIFACLAALMHLGTIGYMVKATIRATTTSANSSALRSQGDSQSNVPMSAKRLRILKARNISRILKKQWRAGLFAICLLVVDMTYWLFYFIEAKKAQGVTANTPWVMQWAFCVITSNGGNSIGEDLQAACAETARPYIPRFAWIVVTEIFPASIGLVTFITFGSKLVFWQDVFGALLCGLRKRDSTVFVMDDISKDKDQRKPGKSNLHSSENDSVEKQTGYQTQDYNDKGDIYSGKSSQSTSAYNSRDVLSNTFSQDYTKENIVHSLTSSPSATTYNAGATFGGPTRKPTKIVDEREPILYINPIANKQFNKEDSENQGKIAPEREQQRVQLVSEGSEQWPSWPSWPTTTTTSSVPQSFSGSPSSSRRRPDLTVRIEEDHPATNHYNILSPTTPYTVGFSPSPAPAYSTPTSPGFYNFDDIGISPPSGQYEQVNHSPSIIPARTSSRNPVVYQGRSQQSPTQYQYPGKRSLDYQSRNNGSALSTPTSPPPSSPPPIPPKNQFRKASLS